MPELPEVQMMCDRLRGRAVGEITGISVLRQNGRYIPNEESGRLIGQKIEEVYRVGKYMVFDLDRGKIVCHNAMSGFWDTADDPWTFDYVEGKRKSSHKDIRVTIHLKDGTVLCFHDSRLFGSLRFYDKTSNDEIPCLKGLGPDALGSWTIEDLFRSTEGSKKEIKSILMDQSNVAGIGNIYSTEALWLACIDPWKKGGDLSKDNVIVIRSCCRVILRRSIGCDAKYTEFLSVYRQKNCRRCDSKIEKGKLDGRTTYFCRKCQDVKETT